MSTRIMKTRRENLLAAMRAKGFVCPEEAATMAKVAQSTIYSWMSDGTLTPETVGKRLKFVSVTALRALVGVAMDPVPSAA